MSLASASWILDTTSWVWNAVTSLLCSTYAVFCTPKLPPELLDKLIDHLYDDRQSLLSLSLVCKQSLAKSRSYLFATICIDSSDPQLDTFLLLLNRPWTSFTSAVETLHLKNIFHPRTRYNYHQFSSIERLVAHLPNVRAVWLTSLSWSCIPSVIRTLLFSLPVLDFQLDRVEFHDSDEAIEFFSMFPPTYSGSISLYDTEYGSIPEFSQIPAVFRQPLRLKTLDTSSLIFLKNVLAQCDSGLAVDSFHLRLPTLRRSQLEEYAAIFPEFLVHFGPSLNRLFIVLCLPGFLVGMHSFYQPFF